MDILGSIGFDWKVALANLVNFAIVFYLLNRFVLSKLKLVLKERKQKIDQGLEDAKKAEAALFMAGQKETEIIGNAHEKANLLIIEASHKGNDLIKQAEKKGLVSGDELVRKAELDIERKMKKAMKESEMIAASLIVSGVKKMLIEQVDGDKNQEFIEKIVTKEKITI